MCEQPPQFKNFVFCKDCDFIGIGELFPSETIDEESNSKQSICPICSGTLLFRANKNHLKSAGILCLNCEGEGRVSRTENDLDPPKCVVCKGKGYSEENGYMKPEGDQQ